MLIAAAAVTRLTIKRNEAPTGIQNLFESIISGLLNYMDEVMGPEGRRYFPLIGALFLFILISNLMGLIPGFDSPTGNINTTAALALVSFFATHVIGLGRHGISYFKHFVGPMPLLAPIMIPIEVISHLARPLSLSFRLFGNMVAKHKLLLVLAVFAPYIAPVPVLALGLFVAFIQAGVFTLLTMFYLGAAIEEAHGSEHH